VAISEYIKQFFGKKMIIFENSEAKKYSSLDFVRKVTGPDPCDYHPGPVYLGLF
jgi:hypothetical protein